MPPFDLHALIDQLKYDPENPLLFNNGFFVFFFAIFMTLYYRFRNNHQVRSYIFCLFSLYFFYKASGMFVMLVIMSAVVDFYLSNTIYKVQDRFTKKGLLVLSIIYNLGLLVYFKYTNFFVATMNDAFDAGFSPLNVLLPVGISFYTFENISYTVDVYRGHFVPVKKFSDYLLFLSFFPKLVMGPIVRANDFIPQIHQPYRITETDFAKGFYLIISGLFKKVVISDFLTVNYVEYIFSDPSRYTGLENLFAVYAYAIVIYCDFSGYSDVAIGIAKWLGFHIPTNFLSPYQSGNITDFWRRWHISLSSWLKDYLYIPLGGNRRASTGTYFFTALIFASSLLVTTHALDLSIWAGLGISLLILLLFILPSLARRDIKGISTNLNLMTTMFLGGLWHGASWNFIVWGGLHGIALAVHKIWLMLTGKALAGVNRRWWYNAIAIFITFHFVCFCWIFFKAKDFSIANDMIHQIRYDFSFSVWGAFFDNYKAVLGMMALAGLLHAVPDNYADRIIGRFPRIPMIAYLVIFFAFVLLYGMFKSAEPVLPIYLQF